MDNLYFDIWDEKEKEDVRRLNGPIFIIGASGFIGAKLFFNLQKIRDDVYACSRAPRHGWRMASVSNSNKLLDLDITNFELLRNIIYKYKPKTVFNLSAYGAYSRQNDFSKIHNVNYTGVLNLIKVLQESGVDAFVHAGSSSEYGLNCKGPSEDAELIPNSDYAVSKVAASYLLKYYGKFFDFPALNLRLYSVYGPFEERDRLIPTLIEHCMDGGRYPNLVDKDISRDFVYIDDCLHALVRSALTIGKLKDKDHHGISLNIASGKKTTLEDVVLCARKIFDIKDEPKWGSMTNRKWDLTNWYGDPSLANKLLNWSSKTSFEEGLKLYADWRKLADKNFKVVPMVAKAKKISAIIACYKDDLAIPIMYKRLQLVFTKLNVDYEIIFVNDCSPYPHKDESVIYELTKTDSSVIGISHSRNFGSQSAFISGMEISSGDAVVLMDGDGQDPPEVIENFVSKWQQGYEVVYGERVKRDAPLYMQMMYKIFYRLFQKLAEIKIPVDAGDFSLIDRKVVDYILKLSEKDIFIRGLRAWVGFKQIGVEYRRPERLFGVTTNSFMKNIWWAKKGIFSFSTRPLHYIQGLGVFIFVLTVFMALFYLINYFINPPSAGSGGKGATTIVLLLLGLGSFQLMAISILGDYIGKITEEVKNRPRFIRDKIFFNGKFYASTDEIVNISNELKKR
ncbi:MAG: NAD-dependent epimerase/dehydratase family protein [Oligoflexia bacterium]|nr:NAD-dependent epimerase/dehydratase family protein [Oligoflexia bacterium]